MKSLQIVIQERSECLQDAKYLRACLLDSGWKGAMLEVVVNLFDSGIVEKIRQGGGILTRLEAHSLAVQQENLYGTFQQFTEKGIELWAEALGASVEPKSIPVPDVLESQATHSERIYSSKLTEKTVEQVAAQAPLGNERVKPKRSKYEQVVLGLGWINVMVWIVLLIETIVSGEPLGFEAFLSMTASQIPIFLMQYHLWKIGFHTPLFPKTGQDSVYLILAYFVIVPCVFYAAYACWAFFDTLGTVEWDFSIPWFLTFSIYHVLWHWEYRKVQAD